MGDCGKSPVFRVAGWFVFRTLVCGLFLLLAGCGDGDNGGAGRSPEPVYDILITGGVLYDGSGGPGFEADLAVTGDRIAAIGDLAGASATLEIDARGRAVSPGFINMLSWAPGALMMDGRGLSDVIQGVTLEVFGEGWSMGPLSDRSRAAIAGIVPDADAFAGQWTTLGEYLDWLTARGVSPNVASFVGATTVRINHIGFEDRPPTAAELDAMRAEVALAMEEGAMGVGSSLIYPPAFYADTAELIALAEVAGRYGGIYTSHMRSEAGRLLESVDELIAIARAARVPANIYHLKAAGRANWDKLDAVFARIEAARAEGLRITADMYPYIAGATGLTATAPPWAQEGGLAAFIARIRDPETRARIIADMRTPTPDWEQMLGLADGDGIILLGFEKAALKPLTGKTLAAVAAERGTSLEDTALDLIAEDESRVAAAYFMMSEDNVARQLARPWVAVNSDAEASAPEGAFLERSTHPRAYGTFARILAKYVREDGVLTLPDAIHRMTALPAGNLGIRDRGRLAEGFHADIVVFDAASVQDHATFTQPFQLATGVDHVFINGVQVIRDGSHTGALPGRVVRGPGYRPAGGTETGG